MALRSKEKAAQRRENAEKRPHATAKYIRISSRKVKVVIDLIRGKSKWQWKNALGGIGLGVINFFSTFCVYNAMRCFDNVVLFPIYNIGVVSLTALTGWLLFKEKLTWKNYLGLAIAIIAVILITLKP